MNKAEKFDSISRHFYSYHSIVARMGLYKKLIVAQIDDSSVDLSQITTSHASKFEIVTRYEVISFYACVNGA